jgi:hypothetical protein
MINRCRIYLQVISILDLLLYGTTTVHPSYVHGDPPPSRIPKITWPNVPKPPAKYWKLWSRVLTINILPLIQTMSIPWKELSDIRYKPRFYKNRYTSHLYIISDGDIIEYKLQNRPRTRLNAIHLPLRSILL